MTRPTVILGLTTLGFFGVGCSRHQEASERPVYLQPQQQAAQEGIAQTSPGTYTTVVNPPRNERRRYSASGQPRQYVVKRRSKKKSAAIVGGSAAAGAAIGALAGGGKGAAIGAIVGGGSGLVYDRTTAKKKTEVK